MPTAKDPETEAKPERGEQREGKLRRGGRDPTQSAVEGDRKPRPRGWGRSPRAHSGGEDGGCAHCCWPGPGGVHVGSCESHSS